MKIAIVHDFLTYWGGAEQALVSLRNLWPEAPVYTLFYEEDFARKYFPNADIRASFLQKFPRFLLQRKKFLLPFLAIAAETLDLRDFDVVISSSSSFAKGIIVKPRTVHISYCHTPTRFLWDWYYEYCRENNFGILKKIFILPLLHYLRLWDRSAADRVDYFIANSKNVARRIKKFYGRDSEVIYPPADVNKLKTQNSKLKTKEQNYFLIVSRLSPYKKVDQAIEAFNKLNLPLVIIGEGSQRKYLERIANKNIKFLGFIAADDLARYYSNARALIFSGEEDFGITAVEAMAAGTPVIACRKGGVCESVVEGVSGEFFETPISTLIADAVWRFINKESGYKREVIASHAQKFSRERFEKEMKEYVEKIMRGCKTRN
ncbi:glycosyltransferase [Patescibacteria group bacterium]|nr:glycosyltransferase [Patescibacteria group bacterium]MBU4000259.1 glycosyltransferase [Patescibacteria group bacterium]MBU4056432.1 glycosyltransferase [Patescibacteria group bacterium]MBU4368511.1 glycosyltransferase [Patescibacteria group bacterium]